MPMILEYTVECPSEDKIQFSYKKLLDSSKESYSIDHKVCLTTTSEIPYVTIDIRKYCSDSEQATHISGFEIRLSKEDMDDLIENYLVVSKIL